MKLLFNITSITTLGNNGGTIIKMSPAIFKDQNLSEGEITLHFPEGGPFEFGLHVVDIRPHNDPCLSVPQL